MEHWVQKQETKNVTEKLLHLSLRVQKLTLLKKLDSLQHMIRIHAPALQRQPDGNDRLKKLNQQLKTLKDTLQQDKPNG